MPAQDSSALPGSPLDAPHPPGTGPALTGPAAGRRKGKASRACAAALPLTVVAAAGAACGWAADRTAAEDRTVVTATGALAAALLGVAVALALSRRRLAREWRDRHETLRAEAARTVAAHADAIRLAAAEVAAAHRALHAAELRRRTAAEAQRSLRALLRAESARAGALEAEAARLAEVTVPRAADRLRAGDPAGTLLTGLPHPAAPAHQRLLSTVLRELATSERLRAAFPGTSHRTEPVRVVDVLRDAASRADACGRVRLHTHSARPAYPVMTAVVAGHAAEGVTHALAELLDRACTFSPPTEDVHVYVRETLSGVVVTIEGIGVESPEETRAGAERLVSGDPPEVDPRTLTGTRLSLAVVGSLARAHGLLVSFRPSARGGAGVVVLLPPEIVTPASEGEPVAPHHPVDPSGDHRAPEGYDALPPVPPDEPAPERARPATPLPKRPRGQALAAAQHWDLTADPTAAWLTPAPKGTPDGS
ncbi:ATP-binding protein [Streptomyces sp.]|uniref:ATP-binding protein n=1 Tax=Streptomyces sp. TaxID=1931 RepID=UPI002F3F4FFF